jgi:hypothetical protein
MILSEHCHSRQGSLFGHPSPSCGQMTHPGVDGLSSSSERIGVSACGNQPIMRLRIDTKDSTVLHADRRFSWLRCLSVTLSFELPDASIQRTTSRTIALGDHIRNPRLDLKLRQKQKAFLRTRTRGKLPIRSAMQSLDRLAMPGARARIPLPRLQRAASRLLPEDSVDRSPAGQRACS